MGLDAVKKRWLGVVVALLLTVGVLSGCAGKQPSGSAMNGTVKIAGSSSVQPLSGDLAEAFMRRNSGAKVMVAGGGTGAGIKAAQDGAADVGSASRELKPEEKGTLKEILIARDGIVIAVNPRNSVQGLTVEQLRKIFAGKITNWKDVGGENASINVFTREEGSGTRGAFEEIVMGKERISNKAVVQNAPGALRVAAARDRYAISYISLGNLNETVKGLAVDGVMPSEETIRNGTYKLARPFLYLTRGEPRGLVKTYLEFVLSPDGQKIVGEMFIPVI